MSFFISSGKWLLGSHSFDTTAPWAAQDEGIFSPNVVNDSQTVFSQPKTTGHRPVATKGKLILLVLLCRDVPVGRLSEVHLTVFHRRCMPKGMNFSTDLL